MFTPPIAPSAAPANQPMRPQDGPRPATSARPAAMNPQGINAGPVGRPLGPLKVGRVPTPFEMPFLGGLQLEMPQAALADLFKNNPMFGGLNG